jgi:FMN reductase [NAD(P)H]
MVRHYEPDSIPRETLERIVRTVRRAPSGGYSQGQRLLVVTDRDTIEQIAEIVGERDWIEHGNEPWLSVAPAHVIVLTREDDYHERYQRPDKLAITGGEEIEWPVPFWFVDAGAAMMLLLLAAIDEGLAAGVYGVTVEARDAFKRLLGIPEDLWVVAGVTLGRGALDPHSSEASSRFKERRRPLEEVVRWECW